MKTKISLSILLLLFISANGTAQILQKYLDSGGLKFLSQASHPTNIFDSGYYDIYDSYVEVRIYSHDKDSGDSVVTKLEVYKSTGNLYFSDIFVIKDTDYVKPFAAIKFEMAILQEFWRNLDQKGYGEMKQSFISNFGTDITNWSGETWALLFLNLDYYSYITR